MITTIITGILIVSLIIVGILASIEDFSKHEVHTFGFLILFAAEMLALPFFAGIIRTLLIYVIIFVPTVFLFLAEKKKMWGSGDTKMFMAHAGLVVITASTIFKDLLPINCTMLILFHMCMYLLMFGIWALITFITKAIIKIAAGSKSKGCPMAHAFLLATVSWLLLWNAGHPLFTIR